MFSQRRKRDSAVFSRYKRATERGKVRKQIDSASHERAPSQRHSPSQRVAWNEFNVSRRPPACSVSHLPSPTALSPQPLEGLREINHGHWEGLTRAEVEEQFVGEYENWSADPFTCTLRSLVYGSAAAMRHRASSNTITSPTLAPCHPLLTAADAPPGGESGLAVLNRSLPHMRDIVEAHAGQTVLVVSHKATIRLLIGAYLGFDLRRYRGALCCPSRNGPRHGKTVCGGSLLRPPARHANPFPFLSLAMHTTRQPRPAAVLPQRARVYRRQAHQGAGAALAWRCSLASSAHLTRVTVSVSPSYNRRD